MSYLTSQRKAIYAVLEKHRDESLTAEQIISLSGEDASRSAVYRNLSLLERQGLIRKTVPSGTKKAQYRYVGSPECRQHLHLECSKCGKTYHLETPATNILIDGVMKNADFRIDSSATVLYGVCRNCRNS